MRREAVPAAPAEEPSHRCELRERFCDALGPLGEGMSAGQVYVTLGRLEKAGLVPSEAPAGLRDRPAHGPDGVVRLNATRRSHVLTDDDLRTSTAVAKRPRAVARSGPHLSTRGVERAHRHATGAQAAWP